MRAKMPSEFQRFFDLFCELDGDGGEQRLEVTRACVEALFDRLLNPPMLDSETLILDDVNAAERVAIGMIEAEANKVREMIRMSDDPQ